MTVDIRRKFKAWERDVARLFTAHAGGKFERTAASGALGKKGDVWQKAPGAVLYGDLIECKHQEAWDVHAWIRKAEVQAGPHRWVLALKCNRESPVGVMDLTALANVFGEIMELREQVETLELEAREAWSREEVE